MKRSLSLLVLLLVLVFSISACNTPAPQPPAQSTCVHTDADDNGRCDTCTVSVLVEVDLFAVNDLHGKIFDTDSQPGVDEFNSYLRLQRKQNPNTILLSSGDMWQGSS